MTSPTPAADLPSLAVTFVTSAARSLLQLAAGALVAPGVLASGQSADFVQVGVGLAVADAEGVGSLLAVAAPEAVAEPVKTAERVLLLLPVPVAHALT